MELEVDAQRKCQHTSRQHLQLQVKGQGGIDVKLMHDYVVARRGLQQLIRKVEVVEDLNAEPHMPVSI